ncbi:hypothetical protein A2833_03270 [Candidatus Azambacteria bacterium RIFCSPHIGHO2_01_FULL_44_55]|uniref:Transcription regulator TrmB N-terminal domain-containing protein n=1 Tax=Candidatus Azambacteria bacterium RIFCSPLOWO2_02_FULL_44_14 TaxID=1797306 RepID=A0A1F5CAL5_9BACT|nr:MAG: hypothetical protein A3C78_00740 [Candidatus Azambacteria bacterium RIFCSPHIGHO2_02_FULL_45_18]OGD39903.1 MAG: hypothetical protein A3I30_01505 [Candidatus Azambacteria bacterium RIFCSPLOWO2_02_FULL_44_14]OGD40792.1 MAG: hypothetical protein A2833_03270 [Candidatus Azambacteria bacterium RIFCSPHIGHO2_01_FULL_44_55]OGD49711.1 MAG: hypothetical protein A2608_01270 [Candidatus Azambacteria bacterium RIFOXYD1_FULL_44_10]
MLVEFELKKLGLSDKEIKVYLALLELGEAAVQKISQKSKVNRATTYVILEGLAKKSLVSEIEKEGKTLYGAQDPEFLFNLFKFQEREIKEKEAEFKKVLPELKAIFNLAPQKPRVRFFEGKEGLKAIQEDILKEKNAEINEFYSSDDIHRIFDKEELNKFAQKRAAQKIKAKAFYTRAAGPLESIKFTELNEIKYLSQKQYPLHVDIIIYGDKIGLISLKDPLMSVIVENKELASAMRSIFRVLWDTK